MPSAVLRLVPPAYSWPENGVYVSDVDVVLPASVGDAVARGAAILGRS